MINNLISLAKKEKIDIEVFTEDCEEYSIEIQNDELNGFDISKICEYKIKALCDGKVVVLHCENIDEPKKIIKLIKSNASLIDNTNENRLCENDYKCEERHKEKLDINYIRSELFKLNDYHKKYSFIKNIYSYFHYLDCRISIDNENHHMSDHYGSHFTYIDLSAEKDGVTKSVNFRIYSDSFNIDDIKKELEQKVNELKLLLDATSVKTNKYKVLLTNNVTNRILSSFVKTFYEKNLDMKMSPFTGKLGEKVFSDKISILEEPLNNKFCVNKHFDNEGVLTYNKTIIDKGVFKTALNTLEYAIKNNTKPTANASGTINLYIKEGDKSFDELVSMIDDGLIINEIQGMHAGVDYQTGDMSLQASGFKVSSGKIVGAIDMVILQSNISEIFGNVLEVGNDLRVFHSSSSSVSLLLEGITVSGNL